MKLSLAVVAALFSFHAFGLEQAIVGGGLGYSDVSLGGFRGSLSFTLKGGFLLNENVRAGLAVSSFFQELGDGDVAIIPVVIEQSYVFDGKLKGAYAGIAGGVISESATARGSGRSGTQHETGGAFGLFAGYAFPLSESQQLGAEFKYLRAAGQPDNYDFTDWLIVYTYAWKLTDSAPAQ